MPHRHMHYKARFDVPDLIMGVKHHLLLQRAFFLVKDMNRIYSKQNATKSETA